MKKDIRILIYSFVVIGAFLVFPTSCKKDEANSDSSSSGTVKDVDGNVYHTVTIGTQVWMVENLKTTKYRNGDPVQNITNDTWKTLTTGAQCNYNDDAVTGNKYGKLYNWYTVNDSRQLAPVGWHVASGTDWGILYNYLTANLGTSGSVINALASKTDWSSSVYIIGDDLTKNNSSGFTALPGGFKRVSGSFGGLSINTGWWAVLEDKTVAASVEMGDNDQGRDDLEAVESDKKMGLSVRCIKD